jgi:hypothetical protein
MGQGGGIFTPLCPLTIPGPILEKASVWLGSRATGNREDILSLQEAMPTQGNQYVTTKAQLGPYLFQEIHTDNPWAHLHPHTESSLGSILGPDSGTCEQKVAH